MNKKGFCALPNEWIRNKMLKEFIATIKRGESIAALKCLLTLNLCMDFYSYTTSEISYSELEKVTNLSRPMVLAGIKILLSRNIIEIEKESSGRKARVYKLVKMDGKWSRVPRDKIIGFIKNINNRGISSLSALKIYLVLLTVRNNESDIVNIGYEKIRDYTGLQSKDIKPGLQVLYEHKLIAVTQEMDDFTRKYKSNSYTILF
ncbi:TPA: hypothetical protein QB387_002154 [Pasteurella multocida]|nr:hypothetical protein [Pasteurella multocida]